MLRHQDHPDEEAGGAEEKADDGDFKVPVKVICSSGHDKGHHGGGRACHYRYPHTLVLKDGN